MALADISGIKSISVPAWLKLSIFLIVLVVLIGDLAIVWVSIKDPLHKEWFSVSMQLLGTLVPLLLVILLFAFSTRGPEAINRRTSHLLLELVPNTISNSLIWDQDFEAIDKAQWNKMRRGNTRIKVAHRPGDFNCVYRIYFPDSDSKPNAARELFLVVQLKVRQANVHLCVPHVAFEDFCRQTGLVGYEAFRTAFGSTLNGAEKVGCKINQVVSKLHISREMTHATVVVYRELSTEFFTDPSEQLFWVQDMVTMLKGFVEDGLNQSQPVDWFPLATQE